MGPPDPDVVYQTRPDSVFSRPECGGSGWWSDPAGGGGHHAK